MKVVFANTEGLFLGDGVMLHVDDHWLADHPFVVRHPELFSATPLYAHSATGRVPLPATPLATETVDAPKARRARV